MLGGSRDDPPTSQKDLIFLKPLILSTSVDMPIFNKKKSLNIKSCGMFYDLDLMRFLLKIGMLNVKGKELKHTLLRNWLVISHPKEFFNVGVAK